MKKRALSLLMAFVMVIGLLPTAVFAAEGTPEKITTAAGFAGMEQAGNYILMADITIEAPYGSQTKKFTGTFDGNGHTITLNIGTDAAPASATYQAAFAYCNNATISNLTVAGNMYVSMAYAAGIAAKADNSTFQNCGANVTIVSKGSNLKQLGGIVGEVNNCQIKNCWSTCSITGSIKDSGGIVGKTVTKGSTISNCYFNGTINGTINSTANSAQVGGIIGNVNKASSIQNCYSTGTVTAKSQAGSFAGRLYAYDSDNNADITNCYTLNTPEYGFQYDSGTTSENIKLKNSDEIKGLASTLGSAFIADKDNINDGYPILSWQKSSGGDTPTPPAEPGISISSTAGTSIWDKNWANKDHQTILTVSYEGMGDEKPAVTWTYQSNNSDAAIVSEDKDSGALVITANKGGVVEVTATAAYGRTEYSATKKITVIPDIVNVDIVNPTGGAVAQGRTVEAKVLTEGNVPYDEENFPELNYQWYWYDALSTESDKIDGKTGKSYAIPANYAHSYLQVEVRCGGIVVRSHEGTYKPVSSAAEGDVQEDASWLYNQMLPYTGAEQKADAELQLKDKAKPHGSAITWTSSDETILDPATGKLTLPETGKKPTVTLTAALEKSGKKLTRTYTITVWSKKDLADYDANLTQQLADDVNAKLGERDVLVPVCGTDTNVLTMVKNRLGREDITVMMGAPVRTNATANLSEDVVNIAADGAITYFYVDLNGEATANLQRFGTFSVTFTFARGDAAVERTFAVTVYWDRAKVGSAMERDIVSNLPAVPSTATENFELPKVVDGKTWTDITWTSSDNAIYISSERQSSADKLLEPYVAVVRGSSVEKTVKLTAKLTFRYTNDVTGSEKPITLLRSYTVTVPASEDGLKYQKALNAVFTADKLTDAATGAALDLDAVKNDIQFPTTRDLGAYMMEQFGEGFDGKYTPLVITSSAPAVIAEPDVANAARVAVYRPAVGKEAKTVTLTVKILDRPSGEGRNYANLPVLAEKRFTVTVKPLTEAEITNELALMAEVKAHYWDGIRNGNSDPEDVTADLAPFVEVYKENGALVWVRDVRKMRNSGIVPVAMKGWQELEAWRLFRSSNPAAVTHENLLVTQQFEGKAVTVTSALSSETLGRYGELYRKNPEAYADYKACDGLYYQPVSAKLVVRGRNTARMVKKMITVNDGMETRLVSEAVEEKVTVSFTLSGNGELWLGTRTLRDMDEGVTVFDVLRQLRNEGVLDFENKGGYVQSITCGGKTLAELDEGKNSGWLYTVNGELPDVYMSAYGLKNGDSIRIYFTKDYTKEPGADRWKPVTPVTKTETVTNADGSVTKIETKPDGTIVETTTKPDGGTVVAETKPDGSVSTVEKRADGTEIKTAQPVSGEITASVSVPKSVGSTRVDIPVSKPSGSMVAVIVHPDGTEEIVRGSVVTETGVALRAEGDVRLKIIDNAKRFNDMADHWAKDAVEFASSRELFNGVGNDAFGPDFSMTRGMVSTVLARLAGADTAGGETWYAKGTVWAVENGISDGTAPEQPVTREQLAAMLYRYAGSPAVSGELSFDDTTVISIWAYDAVRWCVDNGILNGVGGNRMAPQDLARRGQVAAMLMRFLQATV